MLNSITLVAEHGYKWRGLEAIEHIRETQTHKVKILVIQSHTKPYGQSQYLGSGRGLSETFDSDSLRRVAGILLNLEQG